jgi:hypothetical protein
MSLGRAIFLNMRIVSGNIRCVQSSLAIAILIGSMNALLEW